MSTFPITGMATTFAYDRLIPDSAAAGTSLACGKKTYNICISMDSDYNPVPTIAEKAKQAGMKVGIVSSVSIDHATPACFYAHQKSRNYYYEIGHDLPKSGFDYFGGGGFKDPEGKKRVDKDKPAVNVVEAVKQAGYKVVRKRDELNACQPGEKVVAYNEVLDADAALYYELDRKPDHISLAEFTRKGIELLDNPKGFFMMVEGGKIDWACHANDARASIDDTIALDAAVKEALNFLRRYPTQTLILVTADHETGGLSLGFNDPLTDNPNDGKPYAPDGYVTCFEILKNQKVSYIEFEKMVKAVQNPPENLDGTLKDLIKTHYSLDYDQLKPFEQAMLEDAFDRSMKRATNKKSDEEEYLLYGGYDPLTVTVTHLLNRRAGIGFSSYSHTALPAPVLAVGRGALLFEGFYDNTDIPRKIASLMKIDF
jgi:alkaline phosphatase